MHHVQNTCSDSILFTNESHHEHARTLISRTCGTSPTQIDNWHVTPENGFKKNSPEQPTSPVSTHGEVVETTTSETFDAIWFDPSDNMPSAIKTYGNVHDVRSRAGCLSQELAAEISRGAWARIRLISSTQTSPAKKKQFCVPTLTSEWRSDSVLALPHACGRPKRSQITFRRSFPIELPHFER